MTNTNRLRKYWIFLFSSFMLMSCDAALKMTYVVKNKSNNDLKLFVPNYPVDSVPNLYGHRRDTILILKPNECIIVGIDSKIDFPWGRKNIYRNNPGICGLKRFHNDTIVDLNCSKKEWKYRKGQSILILK